VRVRTAGGRGPDTVPLRRVRVGMLLAPVVAVALIPPGSLALGLGARERNRSLLRAESDAPEEEGAEPAIICGELEETPVAFE
jgi:hypothetical protein